MVSQHVAASIRSLVDAHAAPVPAVLEVPSASAPYSPDTDSVFQRVKLLFGGDVSALAAGGEEEGGGA
jgi:vacuolar-type H+-ATPase subunit F/Vma7